MDKGDAVSEDRVFLIEGGRVRQLYVLEGGVVRDSVAGVYEFEAVVEFWQFFEGREVEE